MCKLLDLKTKWVMITLAPLSVKLNSSLWGTGCPLWNCESMLGMFSQNDSQGKACPKINNIQNVFVVLPDSKIT